MLAVHELTDAVDLVLQYIRKVLLSRWEIWLSHFLRVLAKDGFDIDRIGPSIPTLIAWMLEPLHFNLYGKPCCITHYLLYNNHQFQLLKVVCASAVSVMLIYLHRATGISASAW